MRVAVAGLRLSSAMAPARQNQLSISCWPLSSTVMTGREPDVASVLGEPVEIRRSRGDRDVYLFYRLEHPGRWLGVVAKRLDGDGFVITCYPTDAIKIGGQVWTK